MVSEISSSLIRSKHSIIACDSTWAHAIVQQLLHRVSLRARSWYGSELGADGPYFFGTFIHWLLFIMLSWCNALHYAPGHEQR